MDGLAPESVWRICAALAIGLLVGLERGWQAREAEDGERTIGLRSLGLIGLAGGLTGALTDLLGGVFAGLVFVGLAVLLATLYAIGVREKDDLGVTTEVAALATFLLTLLAGLGEVVLAAAGAVVMVLLLGYKQRLHGWVGKLNRDELLAAFKLLLISVVALPLLPDQGIGPWQVLNPYAIWWMVVLIALISFSGYFAVRIAGARTGTVFTALFGGLASSTATTLNLARLAHRAQTPCSGLLAGGIVLACAMMFPRLLLVATLLHQPLFGALVWPAASMAAITFTAAWLLLRRAETLDAEADLLPRNPLELKSAMSFGALLALVMLLGKALTEWLGDAGVYVLAAASGVADVDAITLSLARMARDDLALATAAIGIVLAAGVNSLVKAGLAGVVGTRTLGLRVAAALVPATVAGLAVAVLAG